MSQAARPRLVVTNARATNQLAVHVVQIADFITSGSVVCVLWLLRLHAVPTVTQGFHQALLTTDLGCYKDFRCPGNGLQGSVCAPVS